VKFQRSDLNIAAVPSILRAIIFIRKTLNHRHLEMEGWLTQFREIFLSMKTVLLPKNKKTPMKSKALMMEIQNTLIQLMNEADQPMSL